MPRPRKISQTQLAKQLGISQALVSLALNGRSAGINPDTYKRIWDHAAGSCIASEYGAFVTDIRGNPLDFSPGRGLEKNKGIVCAPARVHGLMLRAIEALRIGAD